MKVGLFGGTFDPVHNGHLAIAQAALQSGLDEVWFLADAQPRHKANVTDYAHRYTMLNLATADNHQLVSDKLDFQKSGVTYDYHKMLEIIQRFPDHKFSLICGADTFIHFNSWDNYVIYIDNCDFLIIKRPQFNKDIIKLVDHLKQKFPKFSYKILDQNDNCSSSAIRADYTHNKSSIHKKVYEYIKINKLY